jgi:hypothetical protein
LLGGAAARAAVGPYGTTARPPAQPTPVGPLNAAQNFDNAGRCYRNSAIERQGEVLAQVGPKLHPRNVGIGQSGAARLNRANLDRLKIAARAVLLGGATARGTTTPKGKSAVAGRVPGVRRDGRVNLTAPERGSLHDSPAIWNLIRLTIERLPHNSELWKGKTQSLHSPAKCSRPPCAACCVLFL